jgi:hypothetical protein
MFKKFNNEKWLIVTLCFQLIILAMVVYNAIQLNNIDKQLDATLESVKTRSVVIDDTSTQTEPTDDASTQTETTQTSSDEVVLYDIRKPHESNIMWCGDPKAGVCRTPSSMIDMESIIRVAYTKMFRFYGDRTEIPDDIKFDAQVDTTLDDYTYNTYVREHYNGARITRVVEDKTNRKIHIYYADTNEGLYRADVKLQKDKHDR